MNAPVTTRPTLAAPTPMAGKAKVIKKVDDLFNNPDIIARLKDVMPKHLTPERMMRIMAQNLRTIPKLRDADPMSLLGAIMTCSYLGLEPNPALGMAYLIPFDKMTYNRETRKREVERTDVQLIIGYRGLMDLARRSGEMVNIHADVVYEGDEISFEYGTNQHLRHVPRGSRAGRTPIWAYAYAKLKDGDAFEVLPYAEVLRIRDQTQAYQTALRAKEAASSAPGMEWKQKTYLETPWVKFEHEMAVKTMIRRLSKMLPMSLEKMHLATQLDTAGDSASIDFRQITMSSGPDFDPTAAITEGEVIEHEDAPEEADAQATAQTTGGGDKAPSTQEMVDRETGEVTDAKPAAQQQAEDPPAQQAKPKAAAKPKAKPPADDDAGMLPSFGV